MNAVAIIEKMQAAGFSLSVDGADLIVQPPGKLTDAQRAFLKAQKARLIDALLEASQPGNEHPPANDGRVTIHVPDLALSTGQRIACDMTIPKANLPALKRTSLRFTLIDDQGAGSLLGEPGMTEGELREVLAEMYGERLEGVEVANG
jgi:hypothetical protein